MSETQKKTVLFELDGEWVLKHRNDYDLPIDLIKAELLKLGIFEIKNCTFTSMDIVYDDQKLDVDDLGDRIDEIFERLYPNEDVKELATIYIEPEDAKEEVASDNKSKNASNENSDSTSLDTENNDKDEEQSNSEIESFWDSFFAEDEDEESKAKSEDKKDKDVSAMEQIGKLIGAGEFKALAKEIVGVAGEIIRTGTQDIFLNQCYLFSIGEGYGLTTYLTLLSKLIKENKLCEMGRVVRETCIGAYSESLEPFSNALNALDRGDPHSVGVLCIDISEWMDRTDNHFFKQFLREVEKHAKDYIIVFRVPFVDKDILNRIKYSLSDLLSVKAVSFPPLSQEEIKSCAQEELSQYKFSVSKNAWKYFFARISEEKSDGKFYGINTVKKVVREIVYQKHLANVSKENKSHVITVNDVKGLCKGEVCSNLSGMEQLDRLVGMDTIKTRINEIIAQIELSRHGDPSKRPCVHMRFIGNPGTGKTTVARIIGKILKEKGVLRIGSFFEYSGRDFCGRYIGETAPKTASMCRDAYGSVMFIDEAYSLYRGDSDSRDFGREAIDTLIAEMENHRSDFLVIMAGYTDDMNHLMEANLGLASRMPYTLEFPNFSREQLYEVFVSMSKGSFKCEDGLYDVAHEFFINLPEEIISAKEFSNARYVRNLFERTWAKAAMRCQLSGKKDITLTREDFEHATADNEFVANMAKKVRIGFNI